MSADVTVDVDRHRQPCDMGRCRSDAHCQRRGLSTKTLRTYPQLVDPFQKLSLIHI